MTVPLRHSLGHRLGDLLAQRCGDEHAALLRTACLAIDAALEQGSTCALLSDLGADLDQLAADLRGSGAVGEGDAPAVLPLRLDGQRLYLHRHFAAERDLAAALRWRALQEPLPIAAAALASVVAGRDPLPSGEVDWQAVAALAALRSRFTVITGGPGTGKTTTVARILRALWAATPQASVALSAPTGKAAARLLETVQEKLPTAPATQLHASTLHRLLGYQPVADRFERSPERPLPYDLVIVDEASMVDLELMRVLVRAVPPAARLLLLGDQDQLTSVAAGQVLADLCAAAGPRHGAGPQLAALAAQALDLQVPARDPAMPLSEAVVTLQRNYRFANQPGIGAFAVASSARDVDAAMAALRHGYDDLVHGPLTPDLDALLQPLLPALQSQLQASSPAEAILRLRACRILCTTRLGPYGVEAHNRAVEQLLLRSGHARHYPGKPILVTANDHHNRLYNGDLGVVWPDADGTLQVWFATEQGQRAVSPLRLPSHETAWAMTVHKSQGSEFDEVLVVLPDRDGPLLQASLLYTAVTRARKRAHVRGDLELIRTMVQRQPQRRSGLVEALRGR